VPQLWNEKSKITTKIYYRKLDNVNMNLSHKPRQKTQQQLCTYVYNST